MPVHIYTIGITTDAGKVPTIVPVTYTFDNDNFFDQLLTAPLVNTPIAMSFTAANLKSWFMVASAPMTVLTNSTGSPANTFSLAAGKPLFWSTDFGGSNPITVNITSMFVSYPGTGSAQLTMHFLLNS